jgi:hypothetical protein
VDVAAAAAAAEAYVENKCCLRDLVLRQLLHVAGHKQAACLFLLHSTQWLCIAFHLKQMRHPAGLLLAFESPAMQRLHPQQHHSTPSARPHMHAARLACTSAAEPACTDQPTSQQRPLQTGDLTLCSGAELDLPSITLLQSAQTHSAALTMMGAQLPWPQK